MSGEAWGSLLLPGEAVRVACVSLYASVLPHNGLDEKRNTKP